MEFARIDFRHFLHPNFMVPVVPEVIDAIEFILSANGFVKFDFSRVKELGIEARGRDSVFTPPNEKAIQMVICTSP